MTAMAHTVAANGIEVYDLGFCGRIEFFENPDSPKVGYALIDRATNHQTDSDLYDAVVRARGFAAAAKKAADAYGLEFKEQKKSWWDITSGRIKTVTHYTIGGANAKVIKDQYDGTYWVSFRLTPAA